MRAKIRGVGIEGVQGQRTATVSVWVVVYDVGERFQRVSSNVEKTKEQEILEARYYMKPRGTGKNSEWIPNENGSSRQISARNWF